MYIYTKMGIGLGPWRWTLLYFIISRSPVFNISLFPVSTAQVIMKFSNNKSCQPSDFSYCLTYLNLFHPVANRGAR
jgi:hypothetical protein